MNHPGFTMGKVRQISANLDGFRCTNNDSSSRINCVKNSSNAIPIGGCACRRPSSYVPYKCTYVPYDSTFGASDQGQRLDM